MIASYLIAFLAMLQTGSTPLPPVPRAVPAPSEPARSKGNLASYVSDADYPPRAIRNEEQGTVSFRLFVNPEGRVDHCEVTVSSGSQSLDETTCRIMTARPQFRPALDSQGRPTWDVVSSRLRWVLPEDNEPFEVPAVRAVPLRPLASLVRPSDYPAEARRARQQGQAAMILSVGPDGRVVDCVVPPASVSQALAEATCRIMVERARFRPARDAAGNPVPDLIPGAVEWMLPARRPPRRRK
jgi:protein TonB